MIKSFTTTGSVVFSRDALNHQSNISYNDAFADGNNARNTFAYPTTFTDADNYSSTAQYEFAFGAVTRRQSPKGAVVKMTYDTAARLTRTATFLDGTTQTEYASTSLTYPTSQNRVTQETTIEAGQPVAFSMQVFDGAGRVIATASEFPNSTGGYRGQQFRYDLMGRVNYTSNPTETNGSYPNWQAAGDDAGWYYTQQQYDWQGRPTITTNVDNTTRQVSYEGCGCAGGETVTLTDEAGRRQKLYHDVLGRTVKGEVLNPNGSVYATTKTTYNLRNQATKVRQYQGDESSSAYQDSDLSYDGYGRLASRKAPVETSATTYLYNADDTVQRRTDPRGAYQTFSYNARHLLLSVSNTKPGTSPGSEESGPLAVPKAADTSFSYDEAGNRTAMVENINGASFGTMSYSYNSLSRLTAETRSYAGLSGQSFTLSYTYNLAGAVKTLTDPFNNVVTYAYNKVGEMTGVTASGYANLPTLASNIRYRAWGAVKHIDYGNGKTLDLSYNNKLLLTRYNLSAVVTEDYQYNNDARLNRLLPTNNAKFERTYAYDHAGRLTQSLTGRAARGQSEDFNDPDPYKQNYGYDAFNNMTMRTNRFWNHDVDPYNATFSNNRNQGWAYDAAGNLKADNRGGQFTYNTASQMTYWYDSTNPTNSIAHSYDGDGQPAKRDETRTGYSRTIYYVRSSVLGGQVIAELKANGQKEFGYIYAQGEELGRDYYNPYLQNFDLLLRHRNPLTDELRETTSLGGLLIEYRKDPLGGYVGAENPYTNDPTPTYEELVGNNSSHIEDANPFNLGSGCTLDGAPIDCGFAIKLANFGGAAVAPLRRIDTQSHQAYLAQQLLGFSPERFYRDQRPSALNGVIDASALLQNQFAARSLLTYVGSQQRSEFNKRFDEGLPTNDSVRKLGHPTMPLPDCVVDVLSMYFDRKLLQSVVIYDKGLPIFAPKTAEAITVGNQVSFKNGYYDPHTIAGIALIAHEVVHVEQFRNYGSTFYFEYFADSAKQFLGTGNPDAAYKANKFEVEAFDKQKAISKELTNLYKGNDPCPK